MAPNEGVGVLRFELPNTSPTSPTVRFKWGVWRDLLHGRSPSDRALLLHEATLGFGDSEFKVYSTTYGLLAARGTWGAARGGGAPAVAA